MIIKPGFNGLAKVGNWLPVNVQLSNDGPAVSGQLQVEIDDSVGPNGFRYRGFGFRPPTVYSVNVSLPSHSRKQYQLEVFLPTLAKSLTATLVTEQGVLVQQSGNLEALSGSDVLCGTLSRNQDFFQQLKNLDLPGRQGKKPFVVPLNPQDVPLRQQALSSLDCLIVNNVSLSGLTNDQKNAILGWVEDGGLFVIGGGAGWQKTIQPLPKALLPVSVNGVRAVPSLRSLTDFAHQPIKGDGPWLVATGKLLRGTAVLQENGVPILVGARQGKGNVVYLAADPTAEPLNTWSGNAALWKYIMAYNSTPLAVYPFFNAFGGFNTIRNWGLPPRSAIYNIAGVEPPSSTWLMLLIGIYVVIAGPVNYLALRLMDRRELGWITIPALIVVGTVTAFQVAGRYQGSDLVLNKISVVRADGNSVLANVRSYVSLYTPRKGNYSVTVPANAAIASYAQPGPIQLTSEGLRSNRWTLKVNDGESVSRVNMNLDDANTGTFFGDSQLQLAGRFDSNLVIQGDAIVGTITNHTGERVDDVIVALGHSVANAGSFRNGETRNIHLSFGPTSPSSPPDATAVKGALVGNGQGDDATVANQVAVLDAFLGSSSNSQPAGLSGLTLLGWLSKSPLQVQVEGFHPSLKETNLYVTSLKVHFPSGTNIVVPSPLIETKEIGTFSTTFQRPGQYELNPSGSLALEFALPIATSDMANNKLVLHVNGRYGGNSRFALSSAPGRPLGQMFLYNWQSSDWDPQDIAWGDNPIPNPEQYLSATSSLRLRYTYKAPVQQPTASVQFSLDLTDEGQLR